MDRALRPRAIVHPFVDVVCVGALSILLCLPFIALGGGYTWSRQGALVITLALAINLPHFIASYRIVYRSRAMMRRHPWAAVYVPLALVLYGGFALAYSGTDTLYVELMAHASGVYLAWHYTGQAWGMIAGFGALSGHPLDGGERRLARIALRTLLVWHVVWFCRFGEDLPWLLSLIGGLYPLVSAAALLSLGLSALAVGRYRKRTGRWPSLPMALPWIAIYVWYLAMARSPTAILCVQVGHALQYLMFPARVEANRVPEGKSAPRALMLWGGALLILGAAFDMLLPLAAAAPVGALFGQQAVALFPIVAFSVLNIHHYFTDGCVWKISDPAVRGELFAHVFPPREAPPPPAPDQAELARERGARRRRHLAVAAGVGVLLLVAEGTARALGVRPRTPARALAWLVPSPSRGWAIAAAPLRQVLLLGDGQDAAVLARVREVAGQRALDQSTPGYGTYQVLLQLLDLREHQPKPPLLVIYAIGLDDDLRNVAADTWLSRAEDLGYGRVPYCTLDEQGLLVRHAPERGLALPLRGRLASVAWLERGYMSLRTHERWAQRARTSLQLLRALQLSCEAWGAPLLVVTGEGTPLELLDQAGVLHQTSALLAPALRELLLKR